MSYTYAVGSPDSFLLGLLLVVQHLLMEDLPLEYSCGIYLGNQITKIPVL